MTTTTIGRRVAAGAMALALVLAGCGDDDDSAAPADDDAASGAEPSAPPTDDGVPEGPPSDTLGAVVMIGDDRFEFTDESTCISTPTAMTSNFRDGSDVRLEVDLPPYDWESDTASSWSPPELELTDRSGEGRRAYLATPGLGERYPETDAAEAVITDYELGDGWATGSGQVIDTSAIVNAEADGVPPPTPLPLSFEIVCAP